MALAFVGWVIFLAGTADLQSNMDAFAQANLNGSLEARSTSYGATSLSLFSHALFTRRYAPRRRVRVVARDVRVRDNPSDGA